MIEILAVEDAIIASSDHVPKLGALAFGARGSLVARAQLVRRLVQLRCQCALDAWNKKSKTKTGVETLLCVFLS
jgi:hypothetical protein